MPDGPKIPVQKQARRHRPALIAIVVAILIAILALIVFGGADEPAVTTVEPTTQTTPAPDSSLPPETPATTN